MKISDKLEGRVLAVRVDEKRKTTMVDVEQGGLDFEAQKSRPVLTFEFYGKSQDKVAEWKVGVGENVVVSGMQLGGRQGSDGRVWMTLQGWIKVIDGGEAMQPVDRPMAKASTQDDLPTEDETMPF